MPVPPLFPSVPPSLRRAAAAAALLSLCPLAWCQGLVALSDTVDVGRTGYRVPVTATFHLRNDGPRHVSVSDVRLGCGCTRADYPHRSIAAGETFTVTLTYDARMLGHFTKQAAVCHSHSKEPLRLVMRGVVQSGWTDYAKVYPCSFGQLLADVDYIEFDDVNKGDRPQTDIHVFNNSLKPMSPRLLHLPSYLHAVVEPELLPAGSPGVIHLTLDSDHLHGFGLTQTNVYMAQQLGERVSQNTEMPVSVVLLPDAATYADGGPAPRLQLSADTVTLGLIGGKMHKRAVVSVTNTGEGTLDISSLQLFTRGMTVTLGKRQLRPLETAKMKISIDRERLLKSRSRPRILMIANDPERPKATIRIIVK